MVINKSKASTEILKVKSNKEITDNIFEMTLEMNQSKGIQIIPGQFINIKVDHVYLRRPISVCRCGDKDLDIVYKVVGEGTKILSQYNGGDNLDVLLPLGNGFDLKKAGERPLLIGGGMGAAPLYGLCRKLKEMGKRPEVALGFSTRNQAFYIDKYQELDVSIKTATINGGMGKQGTIVDLLDELGGDYFYACGPEAMLKGVDKTMANDIDGEMSFESRMGCGFGACMGCSCKTITGNKRICKEGPVMNRREICW